MGGQVRRHRKLKIAAAILVPAVAVLYIILVNVLVSAALVPSFMEKLDAFDEITEESYAEQVHTADIAENRKEALSETELWEARAGQNRWTQISGDGYRLVAAEFPANAFSHRWAVILHGYTGWKEEMYPYAYQYYLRGYNTLVPDLRCQGESEGDFIGMGWTDRQDVLGWMKQILAQDPDAEIVIHGLSMGAACSLMLSGMDELPPNVRAVVSEAAYTDAYSMFRQDAWDWFHLPAFPLIDSANLALQVRGGYDLKKASAIDAVRQSRVPILLIHGDADAMIPVSMAYELYDAAACEKQLLIIPGAGHGQAKDKDPDTYWDTVDTFLAERF